MPVRVTTLLRRLRSIFIFTLIPAILTATLAGTLWSYRRMRPIRKPRRHDARHSPEWQPEGSG